jgi:uncharacterized membrane protein YedE/YeeE
VIDGGASSSVKPSSLAPLYAAVFGRPWLVWGSAVLIATLNVFLFAFDRPWTASDGLRNWGDWVLTGVGLVRRPDLLAPWLYSGSLLNIGVIVGGTIAALLSRGGGRIYLQAVGPAAAGHAWAGAVVATLVAVALVVYTRAGYGPQGVFLLFGAAFGVVFQRSRFCLVRAFREPFMTGDAEHTRAAALALVVATLGFAILKFTDLKDKSEWVFPAAGFGSLAGGLAFGVGMTLAGGCGAGSLWRAGEGQVKLWATVACFAVGASLARLIAVQTGLLQKLGAAIFLPAWLGWGGAIVLIVAIALAWAMLSTWNEETHTFSVV